MPPVPRPPPPKLDKTRLTVSGDRIFYTIQGEGPFIGVPAVFLRLHFCNLNCSWCDTPYTWDTTLDAFYSEPEQWSIEEAAKTVSAYPSKHLVITGGEPLLQQEQIANLLTRLPEFRIEIETNGTIKPIAQITERCWFNVSPKLSNSGMKAERRLKSDSLATFSKLERATFKFVVADPSDLEEVDSLVEEFSIPAERIVIMPEGRDPQLLSARLRDLIPHLQKRGWRALPRLQVYLWGEMRGV